VKLAIENDLISLFEVRENGWLYKKRIEPITGCRKNNTLVVVPGRSIV
jgi:hypothetical protein